MARFEISEEEAGIINTLNNIIKSYGTLLNEEQANKIYKYYRDAYFEKLSRDYTEDDKKRAKDTIEQQLKFLENERKRTRSSFLAKSFKISKVLSLLPSFTNKSSNSTSICSITFCISL